jgi:DNA-binding MarR family transcriptional regulator
MAMLAGHKAKGKPSRKSEPLRDPGASVLLRHLIGVSTALRRTVGEKVVARDHDLTPITSLVVLNLPREGMGISELAKRVHMSVQRTGQVVASLEKVGYVERIQDESDGRARIVVYTDRGRQLLEDMADVDAQVTREIASVLGASRFSRLCKDLAFLDREINGDEDVLLL